MCGADSSASYRLVQGRVQIYPEDLGFIINPFSKVFFKLGIYLACLLSVVRRGTLQLSRVGIRELYAAIKKSSLPIN